jgi:hypothetical protein
MLMNKDNKFKFFSNHNLNFIYLFDEDFRFFELFNIDKCFLFLDDKVFKKHYVSRFEKILRCYHHAYFFNEETGVHYDQFEVFDNNKRKLMSCPFEIKFIEVTLQAKGPVSMPFHSRSCDKVGLEGDVLSLDGLIKDDLDMLDLGR